MVDVVSVRLKSFSDMVDVVSVRLESFTLLSFVEMGDVGFVLLKSVSLLSGVGQPKLRKVWEWALLIFHQGGLCLCSSYTVELSGTVETSVTHTVLVKRSALQWVDWQSWK